VKKAHFLQNKKIPLWIGAGKFTRLEIPKENLESQGVNSSQTIRKNGCSA
jgi:hypothetical protein